MPRTARFTDAEMQDVLARGLSQREAAAVLQCHPALISRRRRRQQAAAGETGRPYDCSWERRLRSVPRRSTVLAVLAREGEEACRERWGEAPSETLRRANG